MTLTPVSGPGEARPGNLQPEAGPGSDLFNGYEREGFFDEMIDESGEVLAHYRKFDAQFRKLSLGEFEKKERSVSLALLRQGVTFNVYGDSRGTARIFP